ncbi:MAG: zinc-dependent alcohol dehydrogenase family protein [Kiloniellaceae bacterium]
MKAAVLEAYNAPLVLRDVPDPEPGKAGAVIRVEANGICRSDWHAWAEHWPGFLKLPHVLGHEMCGTVEAVGPEVTRFRPGQRVIVPFSGGDGVCHWCHSGMPHICEDPVMPGFRSWGGFAELVAVEKADFNLVPLPDEVSFLAGAGMGCRFMTAFHGLTDRVRLSAGEWIVVYGCGGVGLSVVEIASRLGAQVIAVDIGAEKLSLARELGAIAAIDASAVDDPAAAVLDLTAGGAQVSVDALGIQQTCENAVRSLTKRGRHLQVGMTTGQSGGRLQLPIDDIIGKELIVFGSKGMPAHDFPTMLRLVAGGSLDPARLVTKTVSLEEAGSVLASMDRFDTLGFTVIDRF